MSRTLKPCIAIILDDKSTPLGTGFLVSEQGHIITCSHVILSESEQDKGVSLPETVKFYFLTEMVLRDANVLDNWLPYNKGDIVVLQYKGDLPEKVETRHLTVSKNLGQVNNDFHVHGYSKRGGVKSRSANGHIFFEKIESKHGFEVLQLNDTSRLINGGFSGSPVYNNMTGGIVGMVSWIVRPDEFAKDDQFVAAIPSELIQGLYPDILTLHDIDVKASREIKQAEIESRKQELNIQKQNNEDALSPLKVRLFDLQEKVNQAELEITSVRGQLFQAQQNAATQQKQLDILRGVLEEKEQIFKITIQEADNLRADISQKEAEKNREIAEVNQQIKQLEALLKAADEQIEQLKKQIPHDDTHRAFLPVYDLIETEKWVEALAWLEQDEINEGKQTIQIIGDKWILRGHIFMALCDTDAAEKCYIKATEFRDFAERWEVLAKFYEKTGKILYQINSLENAIDCTLTEYDKARLANNIGILYYDLQKYDKSEHYSLRALDIFERLAQQKPDASEGNLSVTLTNLGNLYCDLQKYDKSEEYYLRALDILERLAQQKPDAYEGNLSGTLTNLGNLYCDLQKYDKSEEYYLRALDIRERLAQQKPDAYEGNLSGTLTNLGNLYRALQKYDKSEEYSLRALDILERLAQQNPDAYEGYLSLTLTNLGILYYDLQKYDKSEHYSLRALDIFERLAQQKPDASEGNLSVTLTNLGNLYCDLQKYDKSEEYYLRALDIRERLAQQKPDAYEGNLSGTLTNLGNLYRALQKYDKSEEYSLRALDILERLAQQNPDAYEGYLSLTLTNLGILYYDLQKYDKSEHYSLRALDIFERLAQQNPDAYEGYLSGTLSNLGILYYDLQKYDKSEHYSLRTLDIRERLAQQKPDAYEGYLGTTFINLGILYCNLQKYDKSEEYYLRALGIFERLAQQKPDAYERDLSATLTNLGILYCNLQKYDKSEEYSLRALGIFERLAQQKPDAYEGYLSGTFNNLGILYGDLQKYDKSEEYYLRALDIRERLAQQKSDAYEVDLAKTFYGIARLQQKQGQNPDVYARQAIALFENHPNHPESSHYLFQLRMMVSSFRQVRVKEKNLNDYLNEIKRCAKAKAWDSVLGACRDFEVFYQQLSEEEQTEDKDWYGEMLMWRGRAYSCRTEVSVNPAYDNLYAAHRLFYDTQEKELAWESGFYLMEELGKGILTGISRFLFPNKKRQAEILDIYNALKNLGEPSDKTFLEQITAFLQKKGLLT